MPDFSNKWGVDKAEFSTTEVSTTIVVQLIVTILMLAIVRPKFAMARDAQMHVPNMSWLRVLVVAGSIVGFTYFYPCIVA